MAALLASITFTVHAADVIVEGCENAAQCDDGVFCNGVERCHVYVERGSKGQVIRRTGVCEPGDNPCQRGWQCVNREQVCKQPCEDRDGGRRARHALRWWTTVMTTTPTVFRAMWKYATLPASMKIVMQLRWAAWTVMGTGLFHRCVASFFRTAAAVISDLHAHANWHTKPTRRGRLHGHTLRLYIA